MARARYDLNTLVAIPNDAHVCADKRVYVVEEKRYYQKLHFNMDKKTWIGRAVSDTQMHPSQFYEVLYPNGLKNVKHLNQPVYEKPVGIYAVALKLSEDNGLKIWAYKAQTL